jgi:mannose-6-phosphate isomerase-like protein (cupin superfamily)
MAPNRCGGTDVKKVVLAEKFAEIREHWRPSVVGMLNGQHVKLAKFQGEFVWHHHADEDELFLGVRGRFRVEFRTHVEEIGPGEFVIVPRGVEHRTVAEEEVEVLLFEPVGTRNTGNVQHAALTAGYVSSIRSRHYFQSGAPHPWAWFRNSRSSPSRAA